MGCINSVPDEIINPNFVDNSHFEYMKVVGKGGFGKVNAVTKKTTDEIFAIKRINKREVLKKDPTLYTVTVEFDIMTRVQSPFCLHLICAFQTPTEICMVMPFMRGGDLRYFLEQHGCMQESMAKFYCAELLLGLEDMHSLKVVWRDMKPDNCLLHENGHVKLSDYGISVFLTDKEPMAFGRAGTPGYQAPELMNREKYTYSVDVWSFGIMMYELLHGKLPKIAHDYDKPVDVGKNISTDAADLLKKLLCVDPKLRIGCGARRLGEIKEHPWFQSIDWEKMSRQELSAPFTPDAERANCSNRFSLEDEMAAVNGDDSDEESPLDELQQAQFSKFQYRNKIEGPVIEFNDVFKGLYQRDSPQMQGSESRYQ